MATNIINFPSNQILHDWQQANMWKTSMERKKQGLSYTIIPSFMNDVFIGDNQDITYLNNEIAKCKQRMQYWQEVLVNYVSSMEEKELAPKKIEKYESLIKKYESKIRKIQAWKEKRKLLVAEREAYYQELLEKYGSKE